MIFVHMPSNPGLVALVMATDNTWGFFGGRGVRSAVTLQQMAQLSKVPADFMHSLVNPALSHTVTLTQVCNGQGSKVTAL